MSPGPRRKRETHEAKPNSIADRAIHWTNELDTYCHQPEGRALGQPPSVLTPSRVSALPFPRHDSRTAIYRGTIRSGQRLDLHIASTYDPDSGLTAAMKQAKHGSQPGWTMGLAQELAPWLWGLVALEVVQWIGQSRRGVRLVPVPSRHRFSEALCESLAHEMSRAGLPTEGFQEILGRSPDHNFEMKRLTTFRSRLEAAKHAFEIRTSGHGLDAVLLVDDVVSSGSSIGACAELLAKMGAQSIGAVVLAGDCERYLRHPDASANRGAVG